MTEPDHDPWRRLQRAARQALDEPPAERDGVRLELLLRLQERPTSEPSRTWFVLRTARHHGERVLVHRVTWHQDVDRVRTAPMPAAQLGPRGVPTLARDERELEPTVWQRRLESFCAGLAVPFDVEGASPAEDGCGRGLLLPDLGGARVELCWDEEGPPGWRAFASRVRELRDWLDGRFAV